MPVALEVFTDFEIILIYIKFLLSCPFVCLCIFSIVISSDVSHLIVCDLCSIISTKNALLTWSSFNLYVYQYILTFWVSFNN